MDKITAYIVDDEQLAIDAVTEMLLGHHAIHILGSATSSTEALNDILHLKPQLLFLDIQMPEWNGFDLVTRVLTHYTPAIIFTTAYDAYAIQAFDIHAQGYLLKPIRREKLLATVDLTIKQLKAHQEETLLHQLQSLLQSQSSEVTPLLDKLMIRDAKRIQYIALSDIIYLEAAGDYVKVFTNSRTLLAQYSLHYLQEHLPGNMFLRIHRSWIIRMDMVKEFIPYFNGEYYVVMKQGDKLKLSRRYRDAAKVFFPGL